MKKVACLLSGGVDSAVAALLIKQRGWDVIGYHMKNWDDGEDDGTQCNEMHDAKFVAQILRIELKEVNFVKEYWLQVFEMLLSDYKTGLTPNPDIICNEKIKFGSFMNYAQTNLNDVDLIATGHYAGTSNNFENIGNNVDQKSVQLLRSLDQVKDQTFFLSRISQEALKKVMFPLEHLTKGQVRSIAIENGLERIARKKSSTGICFIGKRKFRNFIQNYLPSAPGLCIDIETGSIIGKHSGAHIYTIGQRVGLKGPNKYFVACKDMKNNVLYVATPVHNQIFYSNRFMTENPHWIRDEPIALKNYQPFRCYYRFQQKDYLMPCVLKKEEDHSLSVELYYEQRALTEGQYAVFYDDIECFGSARIKTVHRRVFRYETMLNAEKVASSSS